jgi:nicotinamide riboside kinase
MDKKIRRICLYGGAGTGKSKLAGRIFGELGRQHHDIEYVQEWIKWWAYEGRKPEGRDQVFIFSNQLRAEELALRHVDLLVTDSPLLLNTAYSTYYGCEDAPELVKIAQRFERDYPALNLYLDRNVPFKQKGRYDDETQCRAFDDFLRHFLVQNLHSTRIGIDVNDFEHIMNLILPALNRQHESDIDKNSKLL